MGLNNNTNKTFLQLRAGKVCKKVTEGTPGAVEHIKEDKSKIYFLEYSSVSGLMTGFRTKAGLNEGDVTACVEIQDAGETFELQFKIGSGYWNSFAKMLPNVDVSKPITFSPFYKEENNKKQTTLFLNQDGNAVKFAYTKENPNGLPEAEAITNKKGDILKWDFSEQEQFLLNMIEKDVLPKIKRTALTSPITQYTTPEQSFNDVPGVKVEELNSDDGDDLPF